MHPKGIIYQCVTNDLTFDQRLLKKARALLADGYDVRLVGRRLKTSAPVPQGIRCYRFPCWLKTGPLFYFEMNLRLFLFLLFRKWKAVVANDADTLLACGMVTMIRSGVLVYDSHELFTEVPELRGKYLKRKLWHLLQKWMVPLSSLQITVASRLASHLSHLYGGQFIAIRNMPHKRTCKVENEPRTLIYQGALNLDRGIELAIDAMVSLDNWKLWIAGSGPVENELKARVAHLGLEGRVTFFGRVEPEQLYDLTCRASAGLNMLHGESLNYYYSLANKFFDYVQAGVPGISMNFPEYQTLCEKYDVAILLDEYTTSALVSALRRLEDEKVRQTMTRECQAAAKEWNWARESQKLIDSYHRTFGEE